MLMGGREHFHSMQEMKEARREEIRHVVVNEPEEGGIRDEWDINHL